MPFYDYRCQECDTIQELFHGMNEGPNKPCILCRKGSLKKIFINAPITNIKNGWMAEAYLYDDEDVYHPEKYGQDWSKPKADNPKVKEVIHANY